MRNKKRTEPVHYFRMMKELTLLGISLLRSGRLRHCDLLLSRASIRDVSPIKKAIGPGLKNCQYDIKNAPLIIIVPKGCLWHQEGKVRGFQLSVFTKLTWQSPQLNDIWIESEPKNVCLEIITFVLYQKQSRPRTGFSEPESSSLAVTRNKKPATSKPETSNQKPASQKIYEEE